MSETKLFINYKHPKERRMMAKDMFLLMFYLIGINSKDLYQLKLPKSGRVSFNRSKTGSKYSNKLEPEALEIIKRYKGDNLLLNVSDRYASNENFTKNVNKKLKEIAKEINENLSEANKERSFPENIPTNWARHTWATIARNDCRINKDDVALCLGHEDQDNRVTDIYIKYNYSIIDESNRKVIDAIK